MTANGLCPSCGGRGPVGTTCGEAVCQRRGYHHVPVEYGEKLAGLGAGEASPHIGLKVDEYLIVDQIGAGGFGTVLLALQLPIGMKAALKLINPEVTVGKRADMMLAKFEGEARALAALNHPNIVRLMKYGLWQGRPYLVMEYVEGGRPLSTELSTAASAGRSTVAHVLHQVLNALEAAHQRDIVHRDIKPENILLQHVAGDPVHVKVLDFGLAKFLAEGGQTSVALGTPRYMAPEQIGREGIGPWTDLYAVGVMTFELLTGRQPFVGDTVQEILATKLDAAHDPVDGLVDLALPSSLLALLRSSLAYYPNERLQDVASFRAALDEAIAALDRAAVGEPALDPADEELSATVPVHQAHALAAAPTPVRPAADEPSSDSGRRRWLLPAFVVAALLLAGTGGWLLQRSSTPATQAADPPSSRSAAGPPAPATANAPALSFEQAARKYPAPDGWVTIPPGTFQLGSPADEPGRYDNEGPVHSVTITRPFFMKKTEVTQGEWEALMGNNPSPFTACGDDCPIHMVTWFEALEYANRLSLKRGFHECYSLQGCTGKAGEGMTCRSAVLKGLGCNGFRLPTEAEWEYAARAGTTAATYGGPLTPRAENHVAELDAIAWYSGNSGVAYPGAQDCAEWQGMQHPAERCGTNPVGRKKPNPWRLYDTIGNVYEWCWDWLGPYAVASATDPTGPAEGKARVTRGGNWLPPARKARVARRGDATPDYRCVGLGFRLVRTAQ